MIAAFQVRRQTSFFVSSSSCLNLRFSAKTFAICVPLTKDEASSSELRSSNEVRAAAGSASAPSAPCKPLIVNNSAGQSQMGFITGHDPILINALPAAVDTASCRSCCLLFGDTRAP
eukprot:2680559-Rhodomonas_salina.1